jgi:flagellar M-ring protein FliF
LRPLLRNLMTPPRRIAVSEEVLRAEMANGHAALGAPQGGPEPYEQKLALARGAVKQDPKRVAQVVKTWLGEDG